MSETSNPITTVEDAVERLYDLNVGTVGSGAQRHERPHKPILLLTVMDMIASGTATPDRIQWSDDLRSTFKRYFEKVRRLNDSDTPENPFVYLRSDGFWNPVLKNEGAIVPLDHPPTVSEAREAKVFASFSNGMQAVVSDAGLRGRLREAIVSRYFPMARAAVEPLFQEHGLRAASVGTDAKTQEELEVGHGRNPAFRRKVLEVYDWQCAACGLRIKLPDSGLTFVDGAHLIPFYESRNDHPTNGIALCKNHHWAMDRFLIVPTIEGRWKASPILDSRRSPGERDLCSLDNQSLLPPHDDAYRPSEEALAWRTKRIYLGS
jgi:putative restriction endonuclease